MTTKTSIMIRIQLPGKYKAKFPYQSAAFNLVPRTFPLQKGKSPGNEVAQLYYWHYQHYLHWANLVPRACDPREGIEGSGIIRYRCHSDMSIPVFCVSPH
jgi:hypothetical protein